MYLQNWRFVENGYVGWEDYIPPIEVDGTDYFEFLKFFGHYHIFRVPWGKFFKMDIISNYMIRFDLRFHVGEDTLFVMDYLSICRSAKVLASSIYRYWQEDEYWSLRYKLSEHEVLLYLSTYMQKYNKLPIELPVFASSTVGIFCSLINKTSRLWKYSPKLLEVQSAFLHNKSLSKRIKHYCKVFISKCLSFANYRQHK